MNVQSRTSITFMPAIIARTQKRTKRQKQTKTNMKREEKSSMNMGPKQQTAKKNKRATHTNVHTRIASTSPICMGEIDGYMNYEAKWNGNFAYLEHIGVSIFFVFDDDGLISWQRVGYWMLVSIQNCLWCLRWLNYIMFGATYTIRFGSLIKHKFWPSTAFVSLWQKSIVSVAATKLNKRQWRMSELKWKKKNKTGEKKMQYLNVNVHSRK